MDVGLDLYCFIPDHAHLLIQIKSTSLIDYYVMKSRTTRAWWADGDVGPL